MKTFSLSAFAFLLFFGASAQAHDIHNTASDHTHRGNLYTHSVSSDYDHHTSHQYGYSKNRNNCYGSRCGSTTTNTSTYYSRSYPVQNNYTYYTTPNTTIHQPPFAYSSCASNNCQSPKRIMVSSNLGARNYTYRAPSEYQAGHNYVTTPRNVRNGCSSRSTTHVSPYRTHKLTSCTTYGCSR